MGIKTKSVGLGPIWLGIYLDENLSVETHVNFLCSKLTRALCCINRAKQFINKHSLKLLYFSLFHSNLLYCIGTLSTMSNANANCIYKIQKKAIRSISNAKYSTSLSCHFFLTLEYCPITSFNNRPSLVLCMEFNTLMVHLLLWTPGLKMYIEMWTMNSDIWIFYNT